MTNLFVPYEIALQLKEKGFDEPCLGLYHTDGMFVLESKVTDHQQYYGQVCMAPLYQQVIDWFRETHNIVVELSYASNIKGESGFKYHLRLSTNYNSKIGLVFPYYEALEKAITEALKLIP